MSNPATVVTTSMILEALFDLLQNVAAFKTVGRKRLLWTDVPADKQPAMFLISNGTQYSPHKTGLPRSRTLDAEIWIYCRTESQARNGPNPLDDFEDAVAKALQPTGGQQSTTLGGLVRDVYIDDDKKVAKWTGDIDGQGLACIPLKILVP